MIAAHAGHATRQREKTIMRHKLQGAVVVLTGASSGIGHLTALLFASAGAKLVLAARERETLEAVVQLCEQRNTQAIAVPTDVRDEAQVRALQRAAIDRFGRIDVWVNDAAVYMLGAFERTPSEQFRALFETNVMGVVHCAKAALAQFRQQGSGTLITVGSVAGKTSYAQASAYCASKHAVHAIHEALRQELLGTRIHACLVVPATIDTPLFQHAANYTGREIRAMPPIYPAERVAEAIVSCAQSPRREVLVGTAARVMSLAQRLAPTLYELLQPRVVEHAHLGSQAVRDTEGNVSHPLPPHTVSGGWKDQQNIRSN
jgi:NADP-dependent 3-hydroxy acid dehydrogenase YdfG